MIKDNTDQFNEQSKYDAEDYLGMIHVDEYIPRPIKEWPEGNYTQMKYYAGEFVGTSYRIKARFNKYKEMNDYRKEHENYHYSVIKITCAIL